MRTEEGAEWPEPFLPDHEREIREMDWESFTTWERYKWEKFREWLRDPNAGPWAEPEVGTWKVIETSLRG